MRPYLGQVKRIEGACLGLLLGHHLDVHRPAREILPLNALIQIPLVALPVLRDNRFRLRVRQVLDALLGFQVELHPYPLIVRRSAC